MPARATCHWLTQIPDAARALPQLAPAPRADAAGLRQRVRVVASGDPLRAADLAQPIEDIDDVICLLPVFPPNDEAYGMLSQGRCDVLLAKTQEWDAYRTYVTQWELDRYLALY